MKKFNLNESDGQMEARLYLADLLNSLNDIKLSLVQRGLRPGSEHGNSAYSVMTPDFDPSYAVFEKPKRS